jgi:cytochrome c-type biogenesis protein CcmH
MTLFLLGALLLALLVSGVLLWGRGAGPRPADLDDPNLSWYRQRQGELAGSDDRALLDDVRLRLVEEGAVGNAVDSALSGAAGGGDGMPVRGADPGFVRHRFTALLLLVLVVLTGLIYTRTGALEDVLIYRDLESLRPGDRPAVEALARRVEGRLAAQPEATQYLGLLGQLQLAAEDLSAAADSYARLAAAYPDDPTAQAQAAQTRFLAAGRRLDSEAQLLAERALALDPQQGTALGLLGMAAFESGQFNAAINYWERLLRLEAPGSEGYRMLSSVLDIARQRAGVPAVAAAGSAATTGGDAAMSPGIRVDLSLPDGARDHSRVHGVRVCASRWGGLAHADRGASFDGVRTAGDRAPVRCRHDGGAGAQRCGRRDGERTAVAQRSAGRGERRLSRQRRPGPCRQRHGRGHRTAGRARRQLRSRPRSRPSTSAPIVLSCAGRYTTSCGIFSSAGAVETLIQICYFV